MADFSMWGPEASGVRLAEQDQLKTMMNEMSMMQTAGQISRLPAQKALDSAHARLYGAQAAEKEAELAVARKIQERMSQLGTQGGETEQDPVDLVDQLGMIELQAGAVKKGSETLARSAQIRARRAIERHRLSSAEKTDFETERIIAQQLGGLAGAVFDQASYDNMRLIARSQGLPMSQLPANYEEAKDFLEQLAEGSMKRVEQLAAADRARANDRADEEAVDRRAERRNRAAYRAATVDYRERALAQRAKAGAGTVGVLNREQRSETGRFVDRQLEQLNLPGLDDTERALVVDEVGNEARRLMAQNRGVMSFSQALAQAFRKEDFEKTQKGLQFPKTKFKPGAGRQATNPLLQVPAKPEERTKGAWYRTSKGVYQWQGTGWAAPSSGGDGGGSGVDLDDDEDDE